jgi:hypothetical protein
MVHKKHLTGFFVIYDFVQRRLKDLFFDVSQNQARGVSMAGRFHHLALTGVFSSSC